MKNAALPGWQADSLYSLGRCDRAATYADVRMDRLWLGMLQVGHLCVHRIVVKVFGDVEAF